MAKIYQVSEYGHMTRFYWFASQKEAINQMSMLEAEATADGEQVSLETTTVEFTTTPRGIAEAMNFVVSLTCFNEG